MDLRARRGHPGRHDRREPRQTRAPAQHDTDDGGELLRLNDGASAIVIASERPLESWRRSDGQVVSSATHALDPQYMGIAPALAIVKALGRAGLSPADIDMWEVHEAFAAQALGVLRELAEQLDGFEVPDDRLNPNGGAVAIGHPSGRPGTRYVLTLATELRLRGSLRRTRRVRRIRPGGRAGPGEHRRVLVVAGSRNLPSPSFEGRQLFGQCVEFCRRKAAIHGDE